MSNLTPIQRQALKKRRKYKPKKAVEEVNVVEQPIATSSNTVQELPTEIKVDLNEYINELQKQYKQNVEAIKAETGEQADYVRVAMTEAEEIWLNVRILAVSETYKKMTDDERISLIQRDFKEFYKNFPVVSRYMICVCQYSSNAFKKMLIKCKETKIPKEYENSSDPMAKRDINEKLWVERQADYIRFLWEENEGSYERSDSDAVWHQAYDSLSKEFQDFKDMHDAAEKKINEEKLKHKKELLYEMGNRLISGSQALNYDDGKKLLIKLKDKLFKQKYNNVVKELTATREPIPETTSGMGTNDYLQALYEKELQESHYKKNYKKMDVSKLMI